MAAQPDRWGGWRRDSDCMCMMAVANLYSPPPYCMLHGMVRVHAGVAVPGTFVQTAAQPGPFSRAKSACHESSFCCGLRARPRWSCWVRAVHPPLPLCTKCSSQATNMLACEPPVVSVVSRGARVGLRDACRRVAECRSLSAMTVSVARSGSGALLLCQTCCQHSGPLGVR